MPFLAIAYGEKGAPVQGAMRSLDAELFATPDASWEQLQAGLSVNSKRLQRSSVDHSERGAFVSFDVSVDEEIAELHGLLFVVCAEACQENRASTDTALLLLQGLERGE